MNINMPEIGNRSDVGRVRKVNEDYFGTFRGPFGTLVIVCDGMGGHKGGAVASRIAVESIKNHFELLGSSFDSRNELKSALLKAHANILQKANEDPELAGMGSTAVLLLIQENNCHYAHVGDSRIYQVRMGEITQITKDHSLVQQMVDAGMITEEAAKNHPKKNVITRALGSEAGNEPEVSQLMQTYKNDKFILCSDGLTGFVEDKELLQMVNKYSPQIASEKLVDLANKRGGKDNITVQIAKITSGQKPKFSDKKKTTYLFYSSIIIFTLAIALFVIFVIYPSLWNDKGTGSGNANTPTVADTSNSKQGNSPAIVFPGNDKKVEVKNNPGISDEKKVKPESKQTKEEIRKPKIEQKKSNKK